MLKTGIVALALLLSACAAREKPVLYMTMTPAWMKEIPKEYAHCALMGWEATGNDAAKMLFYCDGKLVRYAPFKKTK